MSTFLGQLFWVLFWANQLQEILFLILWKNNFFWSKLFEQLFWVILLLKVLFWVNILFKVIFWGLFWVGLLFWGLFWVTFLLQTLFWVNLLKKLLKKVLKKVLLFYFFEFKTFIGKKMDMKMLEMLQVSVWIQVGGRSKAAGINRCKTCYVTWEKFLKIISKPLSDCQTVQSLAWVVREIASSFFGNTLDRDEKYNWSHGRNPRKIRRNHLETSRSLAVVWDGWW